MNQSLSLMLSLIFILALQTITSNSVLIQDYTIENPLPPCKGFIISSPTGAAKIFGYAVDGGGDINDDGIPDIIISEYSNPSTVYVIYGTNTGYSDINVATMLPSQGFRITGLYLLADYNTNYISSTGDIDGDGIADIVIGAGGTDANVGAAFVIYGKAGGYSDFDVSSLPSDKGFRIMSPGGRLGANLSTKVDINGDKIRDIIVAAYAAGSGFNQGAVYVVYGQKARESNVVLQTMPATRGFKISGYPAAYFGAAIGSAGDFNKDYVDDLVITAPGDSGSQGIAHVLYGKNSSFSSFSISTMVPAQGFSLQGQSPIQRLAQVASDAGDFNNDGVSDIAMSTFSASINTGYAMIIYGKKNGPPNFSTGSMTANDGFKLQGVSSNNFFGSALAPFPDINGDGITELIIGAKGYSSSKGALYVIYGRKDKPSTIDLSTFPSSEGFRILSNSANVGLFGASIRNIGDINQDGVPDILVGSPNSGRAYVLFGSNLWACDICMDSRACGACKPEFPYTFNGTCFQKCPKYAPYKIGFQCLSEKPAVEQETQAIPAGLKEALKNLARITNAANKALNMWTPSSILPFLYGQLKTSVIYMRYLNISRTPKLEEMYQLYFDTDASAVPFITMSDSMKDAFPSKLLPYMFRKYDLPSSFVASFGDDLMGLLAAFGVFLTSKLAHFLIKRWIRNFPILRIVLHRISVTMQNFLIGSFGESVGIIVFYASLEFRHTSTGKQYYPISPIVCFLCLILGIFPIVLCLWVLQRFRQVRNSPKKCSRELDVLEKDFEGIAVLFDEFENSSFAKQSAFLVFSIKSIVESLIIGLLFEQPLLQAILLLLLTLILLAYSITKRPFKSRISLAQQIILVFAIFLCNVFFNIMAGTDLSFENFQDIKEKTSEGIFWILVIFQFIPLLFFSISLAESAWRFYKWFPARNNPRSKRNNLHRERLQKISRVNSSFFSVDQQQTVLSLNQTQLNVSDIAIKPELVKDQLSIFEVDGEDSPSSRKISLQSTIMGNQQNYAKNAINGGQSENVQIEQRKTKIKRPPKKL